MFRRLALVTCFTQLNILGQVSLSPWLESESSPKITDYTQKKRSSWRSISNGKVFKNPPPQGFAHYLHIHISEILQPAISWGNLLYSAKPPHHTQAPDDWNQTFENELRAPPTATLLHLPRLLLPSFPLPFQLSVARCLPHTAARAGAPPPWWW